MNFENKTLLITGIGGFIGLRATELAIAHKQTKPAYAGLKPFIFYHDLRKNRV